MFFQGARRLLEAGVTIPRLHAGDPARIVVEAYRAESALLGRVGPLLARDGEEGRAFLKALFATPADLVPNDTELLVRFHSMAQPRLNRALRALCEAATDERHLYPGTSLRMVFEGPSCLIEN